MNKRERALLIDIYARLDVMSALVPFNPANVRLLSEGAHKCAKAAVALQYALFNVTTGDFGEAAHWLAEADAVLGYKEEA